MKGLSKAVRMLQDTLTRNDTAFDTSVADNTANRIDASGEYNYNTGRLFLLENGTFIKDTALLNDPDHFTDFDGKYQLQAKAGDTILFGARELVRYVPNYELLFGAAAWAESTLESGQHIAIEFGNDDFTDGYRYHFQFDDATSSVTLTAEQRAGDSTVDSVPVDLSALEKHGYDYTTPAVFRAFVNWYGAGLCRYDLSYPRRSTTLPYDVLDDADYVRDQDNPTIAKTARSDDVATERINSRIQIRVWAEAGANPVTVNVCSIGALIRGNAQEVDREKPAIFWDINGNISQYPTDNVSSAMAARIDPDRRNVAVKMQPPLFEPGGSGIVMELGVYAVHEDDADLTVNFDDPDDDGTNEGPSPAAQAREQTDVIQYTRDVTSIPTATDIRADGTEGLVPDMRHLTTTIGESGTTSSPGQSSAGELASIKRNVYPADVVIFLPRTRPQGSTTNGTIDWMKPLFEQDF